MIHATRIAGEIQDLIRREGIEPGGRLPTEHALARRFHVSRPLVREAIQALRALGVVESKPRVGLRVLPFRPEAQFDALIPRIRTEDERAELYELRCLLEPAVLRLAARRARPADLEALERPLLVPLPAGRAAVREGLARDIAFHEGLWRIADNRFVLALKGLLVRYFAALERGPVDPESVRRANAQHLAVVRALKAGDVPRAERALVLNLAVFKPGRRSS